jgi:hypothetical protein
MPDMFIRFITEFRNEFDEIKTGIFPAAAYLCRSHIVYDYDKKHLIEIRDWFDVKLEAPDRFSKSKRKNAAKVSLSWFKSSALAHLKKMYEMAGIIEKYDIFITVIKIENPGYIIYEDEFQVSTLPHKKDKNLVK